MNIVNKITLQQLRKNKRRTLVTIIGVIISVAMLTAVATISVSFIDLLKRQEIASNGEWHVLYENVTTEQLEAIGKDENIEKVTLSNELGYALLRESKNENKPYLFIKQYNQKGFEQFPITVTDGRLPENDHEVVISDHIAENGKVHYSIGDMLKLEVGDRVSEDSEMPYMDQQFSLQKSEQGELTETLQHTTEKEFTVVGTIERPTWEPIWAPGYTIITYFDEQSLIANDTVDAVITLKKVGNSIYKDTEKFASDNHIDAYQFNNSLLRYYGVIKNDHMRKTLYSLSGIIMGIILIGSVSLIYNAFAISVADRSKYLGMLSSVGATRKQKRNSVFFESFIIGLISIPLGIIAGLGGIGITFLYINSLIQGAFGLTENLNLVVTPSSIIISVLVSLITIFISASIPAKRASKITAIDAIRQTQDVKLTNKKVKTSKLVRRFFGMEAEIGLKNLKRNKRRYQATVFSIVISIVLFLSVTYFTDNLKKSSELIQNIDNYDMSIMLGYEDDDQFIKSVTSLDNITETNVMTEIDDLTAWVDKETIIEDLREREVDYGNDKYPYYIKLHVLDDAYLKEYAKQVGADDNQLRNEYEAIVVDTASFYDDTKGKYVESKLIHIKPGDKLETYQIDWETDRDIPIGSMKVAAVTDKMPLGASQLSPIYLNMFISENSLKKLRKDASHELNENKYLYVNSDDPINTQKEIEEMEEIKHSIQNHYQIRQEEQQLILLLSVFTYGFIALITAISIANILNTISTSISLRRREFAMLKSVGMTPKGFNKMIRYESIFYGMKALLYGLPLSIGIMLLMYKAISGSFDYNFTLPWLEIFYVIIGVFLIVGISMLYSSSRVKKENIIDALKEENM